MFRVRMLKVLSLILVLNTAAVTDVSAQDKDDDCSQDYAELVDNLLTLWNAELKNCMEAKQNLSEAEMDCFRGTRCDEKEHLRTLERVACNGELKLQKAYFGAVAKSSMTCEELAQFATQFPEIKNASKSRRNNQGEARLLQVKSILKDLGFDDSSIPKIIVVMEQPKGKDLLGTYEQTRTTPQEATIVLYPSAFEPEGALEVAVRHEMMHHTISSSIPKGLEESFASLGKKISDGFDVEFVPEPGNASRLSESELEPFSKGMLDHVMTAAEELYVSEKINAYAKDRLSSDARISAKNTLEIYQGEYSEVWTSAHEVFITNIGTIKYVPKKTTGRVK